MLVKWIQVIEFVEMGIHLIPVHPETLVGECIPKPGQRGQSGSKLRREDAELALLSNRLVVVLWLRCVLKCNDAVANVDAAVRGLPTAVGMRSAMSRRYGSSSKSLLAFP